METNEIKYSLKDGLLQIETTEKEVTVQIFTRQGETYKKLKLTPGITEIALPAPGIYLLTIQIYNRFITRKIEWR